MQARYDVKNVTALADIEALGDITILPYPDDIMAAAKAASEELYEELRGDEDFNTVFESWDAFRQSSGRWFGLAEAAMTNFGAAPAE